MFGFLNGIFTKASKTASVIALNNFGNVAWMNRDVETFAKEGFSKNNVVYTCVNIIATAASSVPWYLATESKNKAGHPDIEALLKMPNPMQSWSKLIYELVAYKLITGNSYLEAVALDSRNVIKELYAPKPQFMKIVPGESFPKQYQYQIGGAKPVTWDVDPITGQSDILHLKKFNPIDHWYGMAPIEAAAYNIDQHNASSRHNMGLLQNGASPSGALVNESDNLTDEQFIELKKDFKEQHQGPKNAGRPLFLTGVYKWLNMGMNLKDIDWANGRDLNARDIGLVFNVPSQLLGIQGSQTYANYEQAMLHVWEFAVIPELVELREALNNFLLPRFDNVGDIQLAFDLDQVTALIQLREKLWGRIGKAKSDGLITVNEARAELGYQPVNNGNDLYVPAGQLPLNYTVDDADMATDADD